MNGAEDVSTAPAFMAQGCSVRVHFTCLTHWLRSWLLFRPGDDGSFGGDRACGGWRDGGRQEQNAGVGLFDGRRLVLYPACSGRLIIYQVVACASLYLVV